MKKLFTLLAAVFVIASVSAEPPRRPAVTLKNFADYEVQIDGRTYRDNNAFVQDLRPGAHRIDVYKSGGGFWGKRRNLISSSDFFLRNNDLTISIGRDGQARIDENRRQDDRGRGYGTSDDRDRDYGWNDNQNRDGGRGNGDYGNTGGGYGSGNNNGGYNTGTYPVPQQTGNYPKPQQNGGWRGN